MVSVFRRKTNQVVEITVSSRTVVRVLLMVILSLVFLAALKKATHALILISTGFFLALALNAPVHWLAVRIPGKRRGSRTLATTLSFVVIIALLVGFLASIVPPLVEQTDNFIHAAPSLVENARKQDNSLGKFVRRYNLEGQIHKFSGQLSDRLDNATSSVVSIFTRVTSSIFAMLTVLVIAFMTLIEGPHWLDVAKRLMPEEKQDHTEKLVLQMYNVIKGFVNGQVLLAAIAASLVLIGLLVTGVSYPIALMVVVFICGLIPLVGHTIGAIIVTTVALFHSPVSAVVILAYYIFYQQIENYAIQPKIQANSTNMSPLLVFSSVIIGVSFGGLFGGLVAIPLAGCIKVLAHDYIDNRNLLSEPE